MYVGSGIKGMGSGITSHEIGISRVFFRDQVVCTFLWDQGPQFVMLLKSMIRNLGAKMGSAMKKHTLLRPWHGHYSMCPPAVHCVVNEFAV